MANPRRIREIIDFVSADTCSEDEVMSGWGVAFDDAGTHPFQATALGKPVTVLAFDADKSHGVRCQVQGEGIAERWVGVDALDGESLPQELRDVVEAFESWSEGDY